ncbi:MAG: SPOR domain-containing protein [Thermochromatium sp.]
MDETETSRPDPAQPAATIPTSGIPGSAQAAGRSGRPTPVGILLQRYLKAQATQIARIMASLNQYREDVQRLEASLIARIGDVDDDRRHAATRLQRTLQTQRNEIDEQLRHHSAFMVMLLLLFSLLIAGLLVFFLFKLNAVQETFEAQMGDLRQTLQRIDTASRNEPDPQTRAQLDQLSAAMAVISQSIARLSEESVPDALDLDLHLAPEPQPTSVHQAEPLPGAESAIAPESPATPESAAEPASDSNPAPTVPITTPSEPSGDSESATTPHTELEQADDTPAHEAPNPASGVQETLAGDADPALSAEPKTGTGDMDIDSQGSDSLVTELIQVGDRPFTVQLIGFHSLEALERFAANHALPMVYYYRQETYQGRPWFVLIHSLHETRESAAAAAAGLPPGLANLNIWIRRLKPDTALVEVRRLGG